MSQKCKIQNAKFKMRDGMPGPLSRFITFSVPGRPGSGLAAGSQGGSVLILNYQRSSLWREIDPKIQIKNAFKIPHHPSSSRRRLKTCAYPSRHLSSFCIFNFELLTPPKAVSRF
jgi:hypothetical protein